MQSVKANKQSAKTLHMIVSYQKQRYQFNAFMFDLI